MAASDDFPVNRELIRTSLSNAECLPLLPAVARAAMQTGHDHDGLGDELELAIHHDPAIAAKLLRAANSAYYGLRKRVPTISRAIAMLGARTVRSLVLSIAFQQVALGRSGAPLFNRMGFWRHSLAVAIGARTIGRTAMPTRTEELFAAGLLHDIGHLVMDMLVPGELNAALGLFASRDIPLAQAEREVSGADHTVFGEMLADVWNLSGELRCAIRFHHTPSRDPLHFGMTVIVHQADILAYNLGLGTVAVRGEARVHPGAERLVTPSLAQSAELSATVLRGVRAVESALGMRA